MSSEKSIHFISLIAFLTFPVAILAGEAERPETIGHEEFVYGEEVSPDSLISRDAWKLRINQARARAEQSRRDWLSRPALGQQLSQDSPEKIATERILGDNTLRAGDIVSTDRGLLLYRGKSKSDPGLGEFVPLSQAK